MTERDPRTNPHGAEQVPDEQPPPNQTDLSNQASLQHGASSRWLVPAGVLAGVVIVLSVIAMQLQFVIPIIAIVFVVALWFVMLAVSRSTSDIRRRNRTLAWIMGGMAIGTALLYIALYGIEASGLVR